MTDGQERDANRRELIKGVFSSQEVKKVGTGTTTRKTIQKAFWFCEEQNDGSVEVQPLNPNYVPSGPKKTVTKDQFLSAFSPEPEMYVATVYPKMRELNKTIARGDRHRSNKEHYSAEMEYGKALQVDEENVRANFGLGITYLERGENAKADNIFERLVKLDAAFEEEHKHLFNEFGIKLRKNKMTDQAVSYYERALELTSNDENLYYNMARALLEKNDIDKVLENLFKSLELNLNLEPAVKFLLWLVSKQLVPEAHKQAVAQVLAKIKQAQASAPVAPAPGATDAKQPPQNDNAEQTEDKGRHQ
ncbi:tetratricopeptide repeat protein [Desulfovibrio sp. OttesenSCG-928-F20]|nr:tetratricopeptide repeat protein [Desulfovibrio sp. OttesenSCG-928-M16]MDL2291003.1 tetratricopeptide repeat protein [Desulfovibrio sp. OttesenSCG-928-F20]